MFDWRKRWTRLTTKKTTEAGGQPQGAAAAAPGNPGTPALAVAGGGMLGGATPAQLRTLTLLAAALATALALATCYQLTRKPLPELPGINAVGKQLAPRYVTAAMGGSRPIGVAVTPEGSRIYEVESAGERLTTVYDRNGKVLSKLAPPDTQEGTRLPMYATMDTAGQLYVTDRMRQVVDVYSPAGAYLMALVIVDENGQGVIPLGINYLGKDASGQELLAITEANERQSRVLLTTLDGTLVRSVGGTHDAQDRGKLSYPNAAVLDKRGRLFVADGNNNRVAVFGSDGRFAGAFGMGDKEGSVGVPRGLYLDSQSRLHIVDMSSHQVVVYDVSAQPTYLFTFGGFGIGNGEFNYPSGIAGDSRGRLYVTDTQTGRVQVWAY